MLPVDVLYGQRTSFPQQKHLRKDWVVVDATNAIVGRLASGVASRLLGKHLSSYTPGFLSGDCVIVINADKARFTGLKAEQKEYRKHSGYFGGLKTKKLKDIQMKEALYFSIRGMLPKTKFGNQLTTRLRIFSDEKHGMDAQKPVKIQL